MTVIRPFKPESENNPKARCLIRVDFPSSQAGITAALRRAFQAPGVVPAGDSAFEELLRRLN